MDVRVQRYERALRWYPQAWRDQHGAALVADLMDQDDVRGRATLSAADRRSLALHGIRKRISEGRAVAGAAITVGAVLVLVAAVAPLGVFALLPGLAVTRITGAVLLGAGVAALLLTGGSQPRSARTVAGLAIGAGAVFLGACVFTLLGPDPVSNGTAVRDMGQFVPLGWGYVAYSILGPALAISAATAALCALGGLLALDSIRRLRQNDALRQASD